MHDSMDGHLRPVTLAALAGLLLTLLLPAPAFAAVAKLTGSVLEVYDVGGETNDVTVSSTGANLLVTEAGAPLSAGPGCSTAGPNQVSCPASGVVSILVWTGNLDDKITINATLPADLHGEDGNDVITGGPGNDALDGGVGNDDLNGGPGSDWALYSDRTASVQVHLDGFPNDGAGSEADNVRTDVENVLGGLGSDFLNGGSGANEIRGGNGADSLTGGHGPDVLMGDAGDDSLSGQGGDDLLDAATGSDAVGGGAGADTATYAGRANAVTADLDGLADDGEAGEGDAIATDVESIIGGDAGDTLTGNAGANLLTGGPGGDQLDAGAGPDVVAGEGGNDVVYARDATTDQLSCGPDADVATVDSHDVLTGCESADAGLAGPPLPPPETTVPLQVPEDAGEAPRVRLPKGPLQMTRRGVIRLRVTCPPGGGDCRGNLVVRLLPRRGARAAATGDRPVVARGRVRLAAGKSSVVKVRASRNGRRRVLRRRRARCSVAVVTTDAQGHRTRSVRTITVEAPAGKGNR